MTGRMMILNLTILLILETPGTFASHRIYCVLIGRMEPFQVREVMLGIRCFSIMSIGGSTAQGLSLLLRFSSVHSEYTIVYGGLPDV